MKLVSLVLVASAALLAQPGVGTGAVAEEQVLNYNGSNLLTSICTAQSVITFGVRPSIRVSISAATNATPVVFTSTGHGFAISARPKVTISGATGNWTSINATFTATIIDANTFSVPINSTTFGALTGTIVFTTTAPRSTVAEWAVQLLTYDGSNNLIWTGWLNGSRQPQAKCSEAALSTTNIQ